MTVYWLLLLYPAAMALSYPQDTPRHGHRPFQRNAMALFVVIYTLLGALRNHVGGDWLSYVDMYNAIKLSNLTTSLTYVDPLYGLINWISSRVGGDIYLVNGICCALLATGAVSVAARFREPWMAIVIAVPYLLIVVGFGYVRQAGAIGMILVALANVDRRRPIRAVLFLALAAGFHSTAVLVHPLFALALARRNKLAAAGGTFVAALLYIYVFAPRLDWLNSAYIDSEYTSTGATVRVLMAATPGAFVLLFRRRFAAEPQARITWLLIAAASVAALAALALSPSSTAVDRVALYFSVIQLAAFGEFRDLLSISQRNVVIVRMALIVLVALIQAIWLVFADHAEFWVPYRTIFQTI